MDRGRGWTDFVWSLAQPVARRIEAEASPSAGPQQAAPSAHTRFDEMRCRRLAACSRDLLLAEIGLAHLLVLAQRLGLVGERDRSGLENGARHA